MVWFGILGPLEVRADDGSVLVLTSTRQSVVLAVLACRPNQVVSSDALVDALWGENPPRTAVKALQVHIVKLRQLLGPDRIVRREPGYLLAVGSGELDADRFVELVDAGRQAMTAGDAGRASAAFAEALALWRGVALAGLDDAAPLAHQTAVWQERRLAAVEEWIDAELSLGRHAGMVAELQRLVAEHPLRERFRARLMVALHRCGRDADALDTYRLGRGALVAELGIEPGAELRAVEHAILRGDPSLAVPEQSASFPAPAMLPADIADFVGRGTLATGIADTVAPIGADRSAPVVAVVAGRPGVGKTALAVHVAHRVAGSFPDGQLYAHLRGATEPTEPGLVLGRFLRALGVDGSAIPSDTDGRAELYRSLLAGRRILVVLDDAASARQLAPLIPGTAGCSVIATARSRLAEVPGADCFDVDTLAPDDAVALLAHIAGPDRPSAEPGTARQIVRLCGLLPLAVRIAGAKLARRPHWRLATLADRLSDQRRRLDELVAGDLDVRTSFAVSYQGLRPDAARALRMLALLDTPDVAAWVVAPLLDTTTDLAEELVETLAEARLLDAVSVERGIRFRMHDLVRLYARERARLEDPEPRRDAAVARALGAWLGIAVRASARMPTRCTRVLGGDGRWPVAEDLVEDLLSDPQAWFDSETANLVAVVEQAASTGRTGLAWKLAECCEVAFEPGDRHDEWGQTHRAALAACQRAGDRLGEAVMSRNLANLAGAEAPGDISEPLAYARRAVEIFHEVGNPAAEADSLAAIGGLLRVHGQHDEALRHLERGIALADGGPDVPTQAQLWIELAFVHSDLERHRAGIDAAGRAVELARECGSLHQEADALQALGGIHGKLGEYEAALTCLQQAVVRATELGSANSQAWALAVMARIHLDLRHFAEARATLDAARTLFQRIHSLIGEAAVLRHLGRLAMTEGKPAEAITTFTTCLAHSRVLGTPLLEALTLTDLGTAHHSAGNHGDALAHWHQARQVYLGMDNTAGAAKVDELVSGAGR